MFRQMILFFFFLTSTAYAQPVSKDFKLKLGSYSADLTFVKKTTRVPYDAILFDTAKLAELKLHFDSLDKGFEKEKKLLVESCIAETDALIFESFNLQDAYDKLKDEYTQESTQKNTLIASLETKLELQERSHSKERTFLYTLSVITLLSGATITYFVIK